MLKTEKGVSLISVVFSLAILLIGLYGYLESARSLHAHSMVLQEKLVAESLVVELLELHRAHSSQDFITYLKKEPVPGTAPYKLCEKINLLDRQSGLIINPDPLADILMPISDRWANSKLTNRTYQVHVMNMDTLQLVTAPYCGVSALSIPLLAENERLLLTVGVTWVPHGKLKLERVVMSTVLPE